MALNSKALSPTLAILNTYFNHVEPLSAYLSSIIRNGSDLLHQNQLQSHEALRDLLATVYVAATTQPKVPKYTATPPVHHIHETLEHSISLLFKKSGKKPNNVLTLGYELKSVGSNLDLGRPAIENKFVNTLVTALRAPEWEALLNMVGEDVVIHLFTETSLFLPLPNGCLCQATGPPLVHVKLSDPRIRPLRTEAQKSDLGSRKRNCESTDEDVPPAKRRKANSGLIHAKPEVHSDRTSPADIIFARSKLYYARPTKASHTNKHIVGLPSKHILNLIHPAFFGKSRPAPEEYTDPDMREQLVHARRLSKYVFPRQYKLPSVFTHNPIRPHLANWGDREANVQRLGACKTPKRLKGVLGLLEKMIWHHKKCGYKALRDIACPSKLKVDDQHKSMDSSVILEMMSEQLIAQADISFDKTFDTTIPSVVIRSEPKPKPRFAEFECSTSEVYRYVVLVSEAVIPKAFWGNEQNFKKTMSHVKTFIMSQRYESTTLHNVLQDFSTSACTWLGAACKPQMRMSVSDALKRRELLEDFMFWYFDGFLIPLLKMTFYVTESSAFRQRLLYFRHDDWEVLCRPLIDKLSSNTFMKLEKSEAEEMLRQRSLGFSYIRLLPKETGVRPIVNLKRNKTGQGQSINQVLQAAFKVLTYEKNRQPNLLGASVIGTSEIFTKLAEFKARLLTQNQAKKSPRFYFVKVDVQACFDTIEQSKLLGIIRTCLSEDGYLIQNHGRVSATHGKVMRRYLRTAWSQHEQPDFIAYAAELAQALKPTIFVDLVKSDYKTRSGLLDLLEQHITENCVKIGNEYYKQVIGIPQGSVLSSLLCSFFYGDLDKNQLHFLDRPDTLMLRMIDDYLLITTELAEARRFLDVMRKGHPEYGCFISKEKTLTNFDYDGQTMNRTSLHDQAFPWCGYLINMKDLSVTFDYSRFHSSYLRDSLTVEIGRRPGAAFRKKMLHLAEHKSHPIFCDVRLNPISVVYQNAYQNFLICAMKMHHYLRVWKPNTTAKSTLLISTIHEMIEYAYMVMQNKNTAGRTDGMPKIERRAIIWLGMHAFYSVLSRKPTRYREITRSLAEEVNSLSNKHTARRFRATIRDASAFMTIMSF